MQIEDIGRLGPAAQKQILRALGKAPRKEEPKTTKYHNQKVERKMPNGSTHVFDSIKEAERYDHLLLALQSGKIQDLRLQAQYTLQESYITAEGDRVRAIRYVADFVYKKENATGEWETVIEDVKSRATKTPQYKLKRKLLIERFNLKIHEY